ncbi:FAD:protein FMN transferase [Pseudogemmobacter sp. W21_MBD1_M6]|uniref:FAD:protein FMN transferase n=1 Tax=Pseudogemmobacter sp. W21_MBD1_M6 TaxID=3240271 RepID=UPI003F99F317
MTLDRRRFLAISACAALPLRAAAQARDVRWRGIALGADVTISLRGVSPQVAKATLANVETRLARLEDQFSLFRPNSAISRLNKQGHLPDPPADILAILRHSHRLNETTSGRFDPTVQPVWNALATSRPGPGQATLAAAQAKVGWAGLVVSPGLVRFAKPGMALTLNGIAQGFATDAIAGLLAREGYTDCLINIGEFRAFGGSWTLGIGGSGGDLIGTTQMTRGAIATSTPSALQFGGSGIGHIIDPQRGPVPPVWASCTVKAPTATIADGLSTALVLTPGTEIAQVLAASGGTGAMMQDADGGIVTYGRF